GRSMLRLAHEAVITLAAVTQHAGAQLARGVLAALPDCLAWLESSRRVAGGLLASEERSADDRISHHETLERAHAAPPTTPSTASNAGLGRHARSKSSG